MSEFINVDVAFPLLSKMNGEFIVINSIADFTTCKRSMISELRKAEEYVLDNSGDYYKTDDIEYVRYINIFGGFSLKFAGFGACRVRKKLKKINTPSFEELQKIANEFLKFYKKMGAGSKKDFYRMQEKINDAKTSSQLLQTILRNMA